MIRGRYLTSLNDLQELLALRQAVCPGWSRDELDDMAVYALIFDEAGAPAGTGRLAIDEDRFTVSRVCVKEDARGQGMGDLILRMLLLRAQELGAGAVYLESPLPLVGFFARYGLSAVSDARMREGSLHRLMSATAAQINLEGACHKQPGRCANCAGGCAGCEADGAVP